MCSEPDKSFVLHYINEVLRIVSLGRLKYVHTGPYHRESRTCGALTHTLSTRGLRRLTQRFSTRIIRGSPAPFALTTLSRIRFSSLLPIFARTLPWGLKKKFQKTKK
jgi:hypothetical protein